VESPGRTDRAGTPPPTDEAIELIRRELAADIGAGDVTGELVPGTASLAAKLVSRGEAVLCGIGFFATAFELASREVQVRLLASDGDRMAPGQAAAEIAGPARPILAAERTALNLLTHLSGVATLTARLVDAVAGTGAVILDTRKTLPGLRALQKYAVRAGGGQNHRMGLFDQILIKDNHVSAAGGRPAELARIASGATDLVVEVEIDSLDDLADALDSGADIVLLDNFSTAELTRAVEITSAHGERNGRRPLLEASGGVGVSNVREIALTGVDRISVGALTHSAPAADFGLDVTAE
jgi:nicotinate-nucleotide pyrophosphorylase (carboxylating)